MRHAITPCSEDQHPSLGADETDRRPTHDERLLRVRHSLAHIMAQAVTELRPGTKLGFGPPTADGFYFDFVLPEPLSVADFPLIEQRMREILRGDPPFQREELPAASAFAFLEAMGQPYKLDYARELVSRGGLAALSFYRSGPFIDMCDGPHVGSAREIPADAFELASIAGAYFRRDARNVMMTRVYARAFLSREELETHRADRAAADERDHKALGKELDFFAFDDDVGKGLPLWLPNGTAVRDELEKLMRELEFEAEYQRVATPHVAKAELFYRTGHLPYYEEHMFPAMNVVDRADGDRRGASTEGGATAEETARQALRLRPMNCPHHHKIFAARRRSYRELPLRLTEYGQVYRYEDSGAVSGLLRVRAMCMNDAHIYCSKEQIPDECANVLAMHRRVYDVLGLTAWRVRLSTRTQGAATASKYVDDPAAWDESQAMLRRVLVASGLPFEEVEGEAAFYGPKIDFQFRAASGREETASTLQLDFAVPARLGLTYVGPDGAEHRPYVIHRAPLGTHERFVALLLEHFAGAFPTWLAPVQVRVVPVTESHHAYAARVVRRLRARMVRADVDRGRETLGKRVRAALLRKVPNVVVVGEREQANESVTLRAHGAAEQRLMPLSEFEARVAEAIALRSPRPL